MIETTQFNVSGNALAIKAIKYTTNFCQCIKFVIDWKGVYKKLLNIILLIIYY